jgi:hypothetical protein
MAETKKKTTKKKAVAPEVTAPKTHKFEVAVPALNVRKSNGYDAEIVKVIHAGTVCEVVDGVGKWGELANGEGWICLDFVKKI